MTILIVPYRRIENSRRVGDPHSSSCAPPLTSRANTRSRRHSFSKARSTRTPGEHGFDDPYAKRHTRRLRGVEELELKVQMFRSRSEPVARSVHFHSPPVNSASPVAHHLTLTHTTRTNNVSKTEMSYKLWCLVDGDSNVFHVFPPSTISELKEMIQKRTKIDLAAHRLNLWKVRYF